MPAAMVGSATGPSPRHIPARELRARASREPAAASSVPGAIGDALICEIYTKRIAGEFYDEPTEAETERERPVRIWLARMDDTNFRYPIKLEARTWLGTIRGRVLNFRSTVGH